MTVFVRAQELRALAHELHAREHDGCAIEIGSEFAQVVGIPGVVGNILDRIFNVEMCQNDRVALGFQLFDARDKFCISWQGSHPLQSFEQVWQM